MSAVSIKIGDRIDLKHTKSAGRSKLIERELRSQLLDFDGYRKAIISVPMLEGKLIPLEVGDTFHMTFFTDGGIFTCEAKVMRRLRERTVFTLEMELQNAPVKNQRREYFRLDCAMPIKVRTLNEREDLILEKLYNNAYEDPEEKDAAVKYLDAIEKNWTEVNLTDISGGGLRFLNAGVLEKNSHIQAQFKIVIGGNEFEITNKLLVVSCIEMPNLGDYDVRCKFLEMRAQIRERLIKYIFDEQRKRMRNDR